MVKIRCISETDEATKLYAELKSITGLPLSTALALATKEFLKNKKGIKSDDELKLFDSIDKLKKTIDRSSGDDLIKIQKRHQQIGNLLNMRVSKLL